MNFSWNVKTIVFIAVSLLLLIGTNAGQYIWYWKPAVTDLTVSYEYRIMMLEEEIDRIGPLVNIWTIKDDKLDLTAGKVIEPDDLVVRELPESFVTRSLVLNPDTILGKYYRIGLLPGTIMSMDMVMEDPMDDTVREYDVVASVMPIGLKVGDYIDFRIIYPFGEDYIVLTQKRVEAINDKTIKLKLNETEIHYYQAALIDYFLQSQNGATLYLTKYIEPGIQEAAMAYYAVPDNILAIMTLDPNVLEKVDAHINETTRTIIDAGIANVTQEAGSAIASGRNEIAGKIDSGETELANTERELREAREREQAQAADDYASSGMSGSSSAPTAPSNPLLDVERGVVE